MCGDFTIWANLHIFHSQTFTVLTCFANRLYTTKTHTREWNLMWLTNAHMQISHHAAALRLMNEWMAKRSTCSDANLKGMCAFPSSRVLLLILFCNNEELSLGLCLLTSCFPSFSMTL